MKLETSNVKHVVKKDALEGFNQYYIFKIKSGIFSGVRIFRGCDVAVFCVWCWGWREKIALASRTKAAGAAWVVVVRRDAYLMPS